jgi:hypothetical protein
MMTLPKLTIGQRHNLIDLTKNKNPALVINTPSGPNPCENEVQTTTAAKQTHMPIIINFGDTNDFMRSVEALQGSEMPPRALQGYYH